MRVAVIGSGISGLAVAWLLQPGHDVVLFEAEPRLGGHTHTVHCRDDGRDLRLETGFMVFNRVNYPHLSRLFERLGVATQEAAMSYSLACDRCGLEYGGSSARGLFAQPANLVRPRHWRLLAGILAFNRLARGLLAQPQSAPPTVGDLAASGALAPQVFEHYVLPMAAAIWSSPVGAVREFPLLVLLRFFDNHGLLGIDTHHQWHTVCGGSSSYVAAMARDLRAVRTATPVRALRRDTGEVTVRLADGTEERFDRAVVAVHADQALHLLADPSIEERQALAAWKYTRNVTILHRDRSHLPAARAAWASWNSRLEDCRAAAPRAEHTYLLNSLQGLDAPRQYQVTLNPLRPIAEETILRRLVYRHPVFDSAAHQSQEVLPRLNGRRNTWFCGAYFGHGFHEDGLRSALAVAADFGAYLS